MNLLAIKENEYEMFHQILSIAFKKKDLFEYLELYLDD